LPRYSATRSTGTSRSRQPTEAEAHPAGGPAGLPHPFSRLAIRQAAAGAGYGLVLNARIDVFLPGLLAGADAGAQRALVPEALRRAHAYQQAGADCVFPIGLWEPDALRAFTDQAGAPVNVLALPMVPSLAELARLGVARVSYASLLHRQAIERFGEALGALAEEAAPAGRGTA
jgi:2-methylisocitrate lyase-like PEP mutase family enzyme